PAPCYRRESGKAGHYMVMGPTGRNGAVAPLTRAAAMPPSPPLQLEPGVEPVAQAVAEQVEGEHGQADRDAGEQDHPRRLAIEVGGIAAQHQAPGRGR